ncbi:VOC family protein [Spirosoma radiotolerans]|uniref:VOC family protein n=1 Tax=Spirosoma radiotolerans TaxID=1379870 RepID=UPI0006990E26|nr:VOC family protein [Spirosoma radiotolerans]
MKLAEEATMRYTSLFNNSVITKISRYGEGAPSPAGTAISVSFQLDGQDSDPIAGHFQRTNPRHERFNKPILSVTTKQPGESGPTFVKTKST